MFCLYGIREGHYGFWDAERELVAKFTSLRLAQKYLKWAKLSTYQDICHNRCEKQFKKKSLLFGYCDAEIEKEVVFEPVPIDPELK